MAPESKPTGSELSSEGRLDSWKEIAAYLKRGVSTVQRWERTEDLPVHRLPHAKSGSVHAYREELDEWWRQRSGRLDAEGAAPDETEPAAPPPEQQRPAGSVLLALLGVFALAASVAYLASRDRPSSLPRITIAVLPFKNLGESADDEYLADGITEEVTTGLARMQPERLSVVARTSMARFKQSPKPINEVARELNADYVLEGSVRQAAGRIRITAQLIEVQRQTHVWAEAYEQPLTDLVRTETEMAEAIARRLSVRLLTRPASLSSTPNPDAHVAYLKGLYFWNKRSAPDLKRAIELFREAIDADPGYAKAHAGLATSYARLATSADALAGREARALAQAGARRALELDPNLPEGHAALSIVLCQFDWDWNACERELAQTVALDPNYASGRQWLGEHLVQRGLFAEGQKARSIDPGSARALADSGYALAKAGRASEARALLAELREIARQRPVSPYDFAVLHAGLGEASLALEQLEKGYAEGATGVRWLRVEPIFDSLRGEPRFQELMRKVGLPD